MNAGTPGPLSSACFSSVASSPVRSSADSLIDQLGPPTVRTCITWPCLTPRPRPLAQAPERDKSRIRKAANGGITRGRGRDPLLCGCTMLTNQPGPTACADLCFGSFSPEMKRGLAARLRGRPLDAWAYLVRCVGETGSQQKAMLPRILAKPLHARLCNLTLTMSFVSPVLLRSRISMCS